MDLILWITAIVAGFGLLVWGADRFVHGAAAIARNLGVSTLVIGLTIVGFGTSAPEMLVSAMAAWGGNSDIGVGNAIGSNIANIGLVVGATAIIMPLEVHSRLLRREFPVLLVAMVGALALMWDGELSRIDGVVLFGALVVIIIWMVWLGRHPQAEEPLIAEFEAEIPPPAPMGPAVFWFVVGLAVLLLSSRMLVWGAVHIAQAMGVSDLVIGLTIVAIGTSLPELAASVAGALKNEHDIAIGNVIGSNMFNLLAVMAMPGLISPGEFAESVLTRDYPVMIVITLAMLGMAYGFRKAGKVSRSEGVVLLVAYFGYLAWLFIVDNG
jgi:cation:H+ antiporter